MIADVPAVPPHSLHIEGDYINRDSDIILSDVCYGSVETVTIVDKNGNVKRYHAYCRSEGAVERLVNTLL